jgi:hypothetical protein
MKETNTHTQSRKQGNLQHLSNDNTKKKKELRGFSPLPNYTNGAIAAGQRS